MQRFISFRLALGWFALCVLSACVRQDASRYFEQAEYVATPLVAATPAPPSSSAGWSPVVLPNVVRAASVSTFVSAAELKPASSTATDWVTHWYRFRVKRNAIAIDPTATMVNASHDLAIYIPRVRWPRLQGRLDVFVNAERLDTKAVVWNSPVLLMVPDRALVGDTADVAIGLSVARGQSGGMSRVAFGSMDELRVRFAWREFFQQRVPQITAISFAILGAFTFAFWLKRRNEIAYLLFTVIAAINLVRNLHYYFVNPESFGELFWWLTINSLGWLLVLAHLFAVRLHAQRFPRVERALIAAIALVTAGSLIAALADVTIERWGPVTYLVQMLAGLAIPTLSSIGAWRSRSRAAMFLAIALWLNVALGVHDFLLQNWRITPESVILLPYAAIAVLAVFFFSITQRYLEAIQNAEELNVSLEQRLAARSAELEKSHRKLRLIEQEQAVTGERQRLMREMHDGLGSSLMSSLVMVEQGKLSSSEVANVLRESIDDLKLTIDSLEPMGDDLLTLLGTLRYRLGKRLEAAGIKLEWQVQETPALPWMNPTSSLQILRILQEGLTNTLKHARATVIRVETAVDGEEVAIRLIDNGVGFDVGSVQPQLTGRGLQNLQRRAATIQGRVEIESRTGETRVTLRLPCERRASPRA